MSQGAARIDTPVGMLHVRVSPDGEVSVEWSRPRAGAADPGASARLAGAIARWVGGEDRALLDVPLPEGTPWQMACWRAARRIPRGETRTYLWLARAACRDLKRPASAAPSLARAAGQAMRRNPAPIVVPCHRVVSASGLGGYAGTDDPRSRSVARKRWLLEIESQHVRDPVDSPPRRAAGHRRT
jgi:methylated-DNA-[protein]-cysteine S-methyltransferase